MHGGISVARRQGGGGYRPLVVAELDGFRDRWNARGNGPLLARSGVAEAIEAGEAVTVSAVLVFRALWRADHPDVEQFAFGGPRFNGRFVLDGDGSIRQASMARPPTVLAR